MFHYRVRKRRDKQNVLDNLRLLGEVMLEVESLGGVSAFKLIIQEGSEHKIQFLADALKPAIVETMLITNSYKTDARLSTTDLALVKCLISNPPTRKLRNRLKVCDINENNNTKTSYNAK